MKGQTYILIIILAIVSLFALKISTSSFYLQENADLSADFFNIKEDLKKTVALAVLDDKNVAESLRNFTDFSKSILKKRGCEQDISFLISEYGDVLTVDINMTISNDNSYISDRFQINKEMI